MARKKANNNIGLAVLQNLSMADLYALYLFVTSDRNRGFNAYDQTTKFMIDKKMKEIEEELYIRAYGCNPFKKTVIEGIRPEEIDLDKIKPSPNFVVLKSKDKKIADEKPETFIVAENK